MIEVDGIEQVEAGPIEQLYAALVEGPAGEAVVGVPILDESAHVPLICTNVGARAGELDFILGELQRVADRLGLVVRVVRFERAGLVGEFRPGGGS